MRAEVRALKKRAIDSLVLAIELFNRPYDRARSEAVFMHLDHAFEMLLKATIVHRGGRIREAKASETISVAKCLGKCVSDADLKCLQPEQALTLQMINGMRDAAQHYILRVSEQQLYMLTQAGLTLFRDLLSLIFKESLARHVPNRVMPVSTDPPKDLQVLMDEEFTQINALIKPGLRRSGEAKARLRPMVIMEGAVTGSDRQPSEAELNRHLKSLRQGVDWRVLLPGVSSLAFATSNGDIAFSLRITKKEGIPVRLVGEGEDTSVVIGVKRVNELDYYSLGFRDLSQKLAQMVSPGKLSAAIWYLNVQNSDEYFKIFTIGKTRFKRYSPKALDFLHRQLPMLDIDLVWHEYRNRAE